MIKRSVSASNLGCRLDACFDVATSPADSRRNVGALSNTGRNSSYIIVSIASKRLIILTKMYSQASEQPVPWVLVLS